MKISHCLWFDSQAEEAAKFYVSLFGGKLGRVSRYTGAGTEVHGQPAGKVMTAEFEILGQTYLALNGGPQFKFNEAFSIIVSCESQAEIDELWAKLTGGGGREVQCGWLQDKYGLFWQIVPKQLGDVMSDPDPARAGRAMQAMLQMKKLDLAALRRAADGG